MFLLYCMTQDEFAPDCTRLSGVGSAAMQEVARNGVRYFYSEWAPGKSAEEIRLQAVEFHRANQKILDSTTLIPFRFPTSVAGRQELAELMQAHSSEYAQELERLHGTAQMKISIEDSASGPSSPSASGTEYLKKKQAATAPVNALIDQIKHITAASAQDIKQSHRQNGVVLFLLVPRDRVERLRTALNGLDVGALKVSISGPWPPSAFVNCYPELQK